MKEGVVRSQHQLDWNMLRAFDVLLTLEEFRVPIQTRSLAQGYLVTTVGVNCFLEHSLFGSGDRVPLWIDDLMYHMRDRFPIPLLYILRYFGVQAVACNLDGDDTGSEPIKAADLRQFHVAMRAELDCCIALAFYAQREEYRRITLLPAVLMNIMMLAPDCHQVSTASGPLTL